AARVVDALRTRRNAQRVVASHDRRIDRPLRRSVPRVDTAQAPRGVFPTGPSGTEAEPPWTTPPPGTGRRLSTRDRRLRDSHEHHRTREVVLPRSLLVREPARQAVRIEAVLHEVRRLPVQTRGLEALQPLHDVERVL